MDTVLSGNFNLHFVYEDMIMLLRNNKIIVKYLEKANDIVFSQ